jgi:enterochelin esterase-like enzyme
MLGSLALAATLTMAKAERDAYFDKPPQNTLRDCGSAPPEIGECRLPPGLSGEDIEARLAAKDVVWWRERDQFVVIARRDTDQAFLCCAARGRMDHVAGDLWAMRLHIADLDHATIDISVRPGATAKEVYRGPAAPPEPIEVKEIRGHLISHVFDSKFLEGQRGVLIYTPPGVDSAKKYPVVYLSDGNFWLDAAEYIEPLILKGELPPLILVGIWPGNSHREEEDLRSEEYLEGWPNGFGYFLKHESFLIKEVMPFVEQNCGASSDPKDRVVAGFSSGAAWAISEGLRHPDIFPNVIAQSLVWSGAEKGLSDSKTTRFFLSAGTLEPEFYKETLKFADLARAAGHDVKLETTVSGHTLTIIRPFSSTA